MCDTDGELVYFMRRSKELKSLICIGPTSSQNALLLTS